MNPDRQAFQSSALHNRPYTLWSMERGRNHKNSTEGFYKELKICNFQKESTVLTDLSSCEFFYPSPQRLLGLGKKNINSLKAKPLEINKIHN